MDWLLLESEDPGPPITEPMAERGSDREAEERRGQQPVREAALGPHGSDSQATQPCSPPEPQLTLSEVARICPLFLLTTACFPPSTRPSSHNLSVHASTHPSTSPQWIHPFIRVTAI